jgi:Zn-dependent protease
MESEDFTYYPPKPEINDKNTASIVKTILSLAAFIGLFLFLPVSVNFIFLVVLVLFLHEMGHLIAMKSYGYEDVGMFFIPFLGAVVTGRKEEMSQFQRVIIILAGPMPGIIIGIGLILGVQYFDFNPYFLVYGVMFIALNVFNLVPVDPLDGGKLFELLFFSFNDTAKMVFHIISSSLLVAVGVYFNSIPVIIFGAFLLTRITTSLRLIKIRKRISLLDIPLDITYANLTDKDYWRIRKEYIHLAKLDNVMEAESKEYDEKEDVLAPAIRNLLKSPVANDVNVWGKLLFFGIWIGSIVACIYVVYPVLNQLRDFFVE